MPVVLEVKFKNDYWSLDNFIGREGTRIFNYNGATNRHQVSSSDVARAHFSFKYEVRTQKIIKMKRKFKDYFWMKDLQIGSKLK